MTTEIKALQNAADDLNLKIYEQFQQDKRRKIKKYFAQRGNDTVSPTLNYDQLNHFLAGWRMSIKFSQQIIQQP